MSELGLICVVVAILAIRAIVFSHKVGCLEDRLEAVEDLLRILRKELGEVNL